jgi:hypothetical protein
MDNTGPHPQVCQRCARPLHPGRGEFYVVRIEAIADPSPPVFTEDDLDQDFDSEIGRLIDRIRTMSEQDLEDQVHRQLAFLLCVRCYNRWIADPTGPIP